MDNYFSVLISVYKKEKASNLDNALYSIVNQSLMPNEIILVEDGKLTKELFNVIDKYVKKYNKLFKVIVLEKNVGLGKALNEGLKYCSYKYVARMDSDDFSLYERFEKEINIIINEKVDVVGSNIDEYDEKMVKLISKKVVPETYEKIIKYAKKRNPINHVTVVFNKNKVLEVGNYMDCPFFEDYYLWIRMLNNGCKFYNIQDSLVKVRGGIDMLNRRGGKNYNICIKNFYNKIYELKYINFIEKILYQNLRIIISSVTIFRKTIYKYFLRKNIKGR